MVNIRRIIEERFVNKRDDEKNDSLGKIIINESTNKGRWY
jgi:hypothetical protein